MKKEDFYNLPKHAGIYMFRNLINGKCYIGQSIKLKKRLLYHINNLEHDRYDAPIYRALKKYGLENFEFKVLMTWHDALGYQTKKYMDMWEKKFIEQYNSLAPNGYNQTEGGDGGIQGYKFNKEQVEKQSSNTKKVQNDDRNTVYCYDITNNKVTTATSIPNLESIIGEKIHRGVFKNKVFKNRYLIARSKDTFQKKIASYKSGTLKASIGVSKLTDEIKQDILNGISEKDFIAKYKLCRKTYNTYKKKLIPNYKRVYKTLIDLQEFSEYLSSHTIKECAEYFNITYNRAYKYKVKLNTK